MTAVAQLNLARRPFENRRPVRRVAIILWVFGAALFLLNGFYFYRHFTGSSEGRDELVTLQAQIDREVETSRRLAEELRTFDLESQNERVAFLNQKIAARTFPWSRLFDHLSEALPRGVRLRSLAPVLDNPSRDGRGRRVDPAQLHAGDRVALGIDAEAEDDEQMLDFYTALWEHPAFQAPFIDQESLESQSNLVSFPIDVVYVPSEERTEATRGEAVDGEMPETNAEDHASDGSDATPIEPAPVEDAR